MRFREKLKEQNFVKKICFTTVWKKLGLRLVWLLTGNSNNYVSNVVWEKCLKYFKFVVLGVTKFDNMH